MGPWTSSSCQVAGGSTRTRSRRVALACCSRGVSPAGRPDLSCGFLRSHSGLCPSRRGPVGGKRCRGRCPARRRVASWSPMHRRSSAGSTRCAAARRSPCCVSDPTTKRCSDRARPRPRAPARAKQGRHGSSLGNCRWRWADGKGVARKMPAMLPSAADSHGRPSLSQSLSLLASGRIVTSCGTVDWTAMMPVSKPAEAC